MRARPCMHVLRSTAYSLAAPAISVEVLKRAIIAGNWKPLVGRAVRCGDAERKVLPLWTTPCALQPHTSPSAPGKPEALAGCQAAVCCGGAKMVAGWGCNEDGAAAPSSATLPGYWAAHQDCHFIVLPVSDEAVCAQHAQERMGSTHA